MDNLRGFYDAQDAREADAFDLSESYALDSEPDTAPADVLGVDEDVEEGIAEGPPPAIGTDERRMQVRAYNFWAGLLEDRNFPAIEDLDPTLLPDFGPNSVLLDFSTGLEDPSINFIGDVLAPECLTDGRVPKRLSEVPPRSLLSRITDHYMQILANQSPIGFEAEFVNAVGATVLYRGILLPFSSDDETIDFIFGVINWKELADSRSARELQLEIDQALDDTLAARESEAEAADLTDWADGPSSLLADADLAAEDARPSFDFSDQSPERTEIDAPAEREPEALADWLARAREGAQAASASEDRTRAALYEAVGRAWDFALAAADAPGDFAELLEDAGIAMQDRAPMTPIVKLVFGAHYDKTRLTEYAAVLAWAQRNDVASGALAERLSGTQGGLKAVVADERAHRRALSGTAPRPRKAVRQSTARKLRAIAPASLDTLSAQGEEFALVMIRREENGAIRVLGEVPEDVALIEKAARSLIG